MSVLDELKKDVDELKKFVESSARPNVRDMLTIDLRKVERHLVQKMEEEEHQRKVEASMAGGVTPVPLRDQQFFAKIKNYAWDQSDKFMKLYIDLKGVQTIPSENVVSKFTDRCVELRVLNLNNTTHELLISRVCEDLDPVGSYHKVKTDSLLVMMKKKESGKQWAYVTEAEKKEKDTKKPSVEENDDPNASIMKMMQNMYEDGDDEMKRTIAKAWSESRDKQPQM